MLGKTGFGTMFKLLLVSILVAAMILFSFPLKVNSEFEQWVAYVPSADQVSFDYWAENGVSYVEVLIVFPSSGYKVTDWGTPNIIAGTISVDAKIWDWTGFDLQVITPMSYTYDLGRLPAGEYVFVFSAWGFPVMDTKFTVSALPLVGGEVELRGKVVANEVWGDFVCYGSYYCSVTVEQVFYDPNGTLSVGENVSVCYLESMSLKIGDRVECYGFYFKWIGPLQCLGRVCCIGKPYYVSRLKLTLEEVKTKSSQYVNETIEVVGEIVGVLLVCPEDSTRCIYQFSDGTGTATFLWFPELLDGWYKLAGNLTYFVGSMPVTDIFGDGMKGTASWAASEGYYVWTIELTSLADITDDGKIDIQDVAKAGVAFASFPGHPRWNPQADINGDNTVNIIDLALIARKIGKIL